MKSVKKKAKKLYSKGKTPYEISVELDMDIKLVYELLKG